MTRDEVMEMTDDELRIKAAELMGWKKLGEPKTIPVMGSPGHYIHLDLWWERPDGRKEESPPDYPNDIAAAWPLTDRMMGRMSLLQMMMGEDGRLGICGWKFDDDGRTVWTLDAVGNDIAPRTITRAFILAMGGDDV